MHDPLSRICIQKRIFKEFAKTSAYRDYVSSGWVTDPQQKGPIAAENKKRSMEGVMVVVFLFAMLLFTASPSTLITNTVFFVTSAYPKTGTHFVPEIAEKIAISGQVHTMKVQ